MTARQNNLLRLVPAPADTGAVLVQGLVDLYKSVKGAGFYPEGHPYRTEPLMRAFNGFQRLVAERELVLTVNRQGFVPGGDGAEGNSMVLQLAHECFVRRIATITFMPDLLLSDLDIFAALLSGDPYKTSTAGGFGKRLEEAGARTIWVNEKDVSSIWRKRGMPVFTGEGDWDGVAVSKSETQESDAGKSIDELLRLMAAERSDARYQELGRQVVEKFRENPSGIPLLPVLDELLRQHHDDNRSVPQKEYALFALERIADESPDLLLDHLENREGPDKDGLYRIFSALGVKGAYWIIQRICLADGVFQRKLLAGALVRLGPVAVAPVIAMLKDERWYVVRNMVTILGELRSSDSVVALKRALHHNDLRVRKEAIRALMRIGGEPAETTLMTLLEQPDDGVIRHVILSLGLMRSRQAVPVLLRILERRDLLLKEIAVKKEIVTALGRIGDRRAMPILIKIMKSRGWPVLGKWQDLRVCAASALGAIGDESALPVLTPLAEGKGPLAESCREAIDAIERVSGEEIDG